MHSFSAYCRLNVPISASDRSVIRAASQKINPPARFDPARRGDRHTYFRAMLDHHHDARDLAAHHRM
ncbi:hypothetical protein [Paracoccus tegillarcae]|uniref:Uncharacterized protein n=1 Tax=Paracoccus tegillarcae TaxID=1529068 RepID=A0A2K9EL11_9RHOB|nr:hypothetical protein [Paracoccus tegillarcae]AUH35668.1 hypothetical protein CUV01_18965 [Paracoccus tegillarcae]AUH35728.1 hypothetical protein CUV01_19285 [Paracoccus tegillarcae]